MTRLYALLPLAAAALLQAGCAGIRPPPGAVMVERPMVTTGYCKCRKCCGWRYVRGRPVDAAGRPKKVGVTASGERARHGTIAADRSYPFGTVMFVPGYGYGRVEDRGGAIAGDRLDLFFSSHSQALKWGKRVREVKIWLRRKTLGRD